MDDRSFQFLISEHQHLRAEIVSLRKYVWTIVSLYVTSTAAIWGWLAIYRGPIAPVAEYIPLTLTFLTGFFVLSLDAQIRASGRYIQKIESAVGLPDGLGRERDLASDRNKVWRRLELLTWVVFFGAALLANIVALRLIRI